MSNTIVTRKPFHEVVVEMIPQVGNEELGVLGSLLVRTTIPKDHEKILAAWNKRCTDLGWEPESIAYVADDILLHKTEIEDAQKQKEGKNPLDRFQFVDEKHA